MFLKQQQLIMYEVALGSQFCSKGINFCRESIFLLLQKQPDPLGTIFPSFIDGETENV